MRYGIATTITSPRRGRGDDRGALRRLAEPAYGASPFVALLPSSETPDYAHVVSTNRIDISAVHDPRTGNFVLTSALDNVRKGASGQAVQIHESLVRLRRDRRSCV